MRIVDLFSGAGGLTFGFYYKRSKNKFIKDKTCDIIFANEFNHSAAESFRINFPDVNMIEKDIKLLSEEDIFSLTKNKDVDIIIGGPPCQSFSTVGKRIYDDKAKMYEQYLRVLNIIRPKMFLFENVKGILSMNEIYYKLDSNGNILYETIIKNNKKKYKRPIIDYKGDKILNKITKLFNEIENDFGYKVYTKVLKASDYGVPQNRERVFIVGVRNDIDKVWDFPQGTFDGRKKPYVTIKDAIDDLPSLKAGETSLSFYEKNPTNDYQSLMRNGSNCINLHFSSNYGDKIKTVIENVRQGQGKNDFNALVDSGKVNSKYRLTSGYANTYGRLIESQPSTTITNNLMTPSSLRCIHYRDNRALTAREGARIQSFPDWFKFLGKKSDIVMQIGNAVPPILAMSIALKIKDFLGD